MQGDAPATVLELLASALCYYHTVTIYYCILLLLLLLLFAVRLACLQALQATNNAKMPHMTTHAWLLEQVPKSDTLRTSSCSGSLGACRSWAMHACTYGHGSIHANSWRVTSSERSQKRFPTL